MEFELRLYEDTPFAGAETMLSPGRPRAIYVASGEATINGRPLPSDEGMVSGDGLTIAVGAEGATLWRFELVPAGVAGAALDGRGHLKLAYAIRPERIADELLLRLDSVAFPAGGCALLHTHQGPGIRCLKEGAVRIDTEGRSSAYAPGGAWFEAGPEPVFAQADSTLDSRFIRAMVLPRSLMGASSIRYVNDADRDKPKSQRYRVFAEAAITLPGA